MSSDVLGFWNSRAALSDKAGSNDLIAKSIEVEALSQYFEDGLDVMEFGCGNGVTALEMARRFNISMQAYDFSSEMIDAAKLLANEVEFSHSVNFSVGDITKPPKIERQFDLIFTERMIINLPDWDSQVRAIKTLSGYLKPGGKLLLMECSMPGLSEINQLRELTGLQKIIPPWHNIYLDDSKVADLLIDHCRLIDVLPYSGTYYFLSRVVNAWLAKEAGLEPAYDAPINQIAKLLPAMGEHAQGKIWVIQRNEECLD